MPGSIAREDGLLVHGTYLRERPGANTSFNPAVKLGQTQVNPDTFARWLANYEARWDLLRLHSAARDPCRCTNDGVATVPTSLVAEADR